MGLMDELRKLARPYEDEDEEYDEELEDTAEDEEEAEAPAEPAPRRSFRRESRETAAPVRETPRPTRESARSYSAGSSYEPSPRRGDKVVNINATTQLQVVLVKPDRFDLVSDIADHLRDKQAVVLNLESTNKDVARRLVDFLSGCAYALDGKIKKIAISTYIITPYNVDIVGDLIDELENKGVYL